MNWFELLLIIYFGLNLIGTGIALWYCFIHGDMTLNDLFRIIMLALFGVPIVIAIIIYQTIPYIVFLPHYLWHKGNIIKIWSKRK